MNELCVLEKFSTELSTFPPFTSCSSRNSLAMLFPPFKSRHMSRCRDSSDNFLGSLGDSTSKFVLNNSRNSSRSERQLSFRKNFICIRVQSSTEINEFLKSRASNPPAVASGRLRSFKQTTRRNSIQNHSTASSAAHLTFTEILFSSLHRKPIRGSMKLVPIRSED
jgi:hypothetical protein